MAITIIKNIPISGTNIRSWFWYMYTLFAPGGALNSLWPVVGSSGDFTSESTLVQGNYFRIQGLSAWADGTRQEFLFGYRTSAGAIGGYTGLFAGNHCIGAPKGGLDDGSSPGWDGVAQTYAAPVASGMPSFTANMNPGAMHLWADADSIMGICDNGSDGTWTDFAFYLGKLGSFDSNAKPWLLAWVTTSANVDNSWVGTSNPFLKCLAVDEATCVNAAITPTSNAGAIQITAKDNKIIALPLLLVKDRAVTQKIVGYMLLNARRGTPTSTGLAYNTVFNANQNIFINDFILPWSA